MGVPAFYRWLSERYPNIVIYAKEDSDPGDLKEPNPNGFEIDNLYLDMNCLIHPCTHPEEGEAPSSEEEMFSAVFKYVDRLVALVRPRKVLYLAIDGVAPRAKMNQQRSRRFRSAQENDEAFEMEKKLRKELQSTGQKVPEKPTKPWDHNVITPGTPFMTKLSKRFREYVLLRQNRSLFWKQLRVIYSDGNTPGEGEHKLMEFIRRQRQQPHHDPNTVHCLYGLDADLIMLGLATHEARFLILREEVLFGKKKREKESFKVDQVLQSRIPGATAQDQLISEQYDLLKKQKKPFQFLKVSVLREYLSHEFGPSQFYSQLSFSLELERCIDDFIFLCFFVGNDFLPHLPTLSIREGGLELLIDLYKRFLPTIGGYLTNNGEIYLERVQVILEGLSKVEDEIFRRRRSFEKNMQRRKEERQQTKSKFEDRAGNALSKDKFKLHLKEKLQEKNRFKVMDEGEEGTEKEGVVVDSIQLGLPGWKTRYYKKKFALSSDEEVAVFRKKIAREYVKGLVWVFLYYYNGCQSWSWFYPFHYAPFASDLVSIAGLQEELYQRDSKKRLVVFGNSKPSSPFEQLLGVLPSQSAHALPKPFQWYMTDEDSPIIQFYPTEFKYDPNGKGVKWLWIALLPFIDEEEISKVMQEVEPKLSAKEIKRNQPSSPLLFLNSKTDYGRELLAKVDEIEDDSAAVKIDGENMSGYAQPYQSKFTLGKCVKSKNAFLGEHDSNNVMLAKYSLPGEVSSFKYSSRLLPGARIPSSILSDMDIRSVLERSPRRGHFVGNIYGELHGGQRRPRNSIPRSWGSMEPKRKYPRVRNLQQNSGPLSERSRMYHQQRHPPRSYHEQQPRRGGYQHQHNLYGHSRRPPPRSNDRRNDPSDVLARIEAKLRKQHRK